MGEKRKDKKIFRAIMNCIVFVICIIIVFIAYLSYFCFTYQNIKPQFLADYIHKIDKNNIVDNTFSFFRKDDVPVNSDNNKKDNEKIFEWENYPNVDGAVVTENLNLAFKLDFTQSLDNKELRLRHSNAYSAYEKLINKEVDLIIIPKPSNDELELAKQKNIEIVMEKVANDGLIFFVDKSNPVDSLKLEQIQKIYSGEITNWKELGGNDEKILAYQSPQDSYTQIEMENLVIGDNKIINPVTEDVIYKGERITDVVSPYQQSTNAIGYSFGSNANSIYSNNIKRLKIDGIEPNKGTISNGQYPLATSYYIVTRKEEAEKVEILKNQMLSARGQSIVEKAGYISIK